MTIKKLIEEAHERQLSYGLTNPTDDIKRFCSYVIEETNEVQRELTEGPNRYKPFKPSKPVDQKALAAELADLFIHTMNTLAVSGISAETLTKTIESKLQYNKTRKDHI